MAHIVRDRNGRFATKSGGGGAGLKKAKRQSFKNVNGPQARLKTVSARARKALNVAHAPAGSKRNPGPSKAQRSAASKMHSKLGGRVNRRKYRNSSRGWAQSIRNGPH